MFLVETLAHLFHPRRSNNHRPRVLHPEAIVVLSLVVIGFVTTLSVLPRISEPFGQVLGFASSITPSQVIEQTNQKRAAEGLGPLSINQKLNEAAQAKGQHMFLEQYWAHTAPDGTQPWKFFKDSGYSYKVAGENLARDFSSTDEMMQGWMASPTHRANIMNNRYQEIGIAVIDGTLQGYETTLVVQLFGTPGEVATNRPAPAQVLPKAAASDPAPASEPETVTIEATAPSPNVVPNLVQRDAAAGPTPAVLASSLIPRGSLTVPPLFSPLQITKAFFLAMIMMIMGTLLYDSVIIGHRGLMRLVGQNLAHLVLFIVVAFLVISFRGGILG